MNYLILKRSGDLARHFTELPIIKEDNRDECEKYLHIKGQSYQYRTMSYEVWSDGDDVYLLVEARQ